MAHPNDELIQRFYAAFDRCDGEAMAACYAPDARFDDPVFPGLRGAEPGQLWRMLTARATDL
jgi:ketosteroid isomerase-like protein